MNMFSCTYSKGYILKRGQLYLWSKAYIQCVRSTQDVNMVHVHTKHETLIYGAQHKQLCVCVCVWVNCISVDIKICVCNFKEDPTDCLSHRNVSIMA